MKIYFYSNKKSINSYLIINEVSKEAILIDPCDIVQYFIEKLENTKCILKAVCITNSNIEEIKRGVKTWQNIYEFLIFEASNLFNGAKDCTKLIQLSSFNIEAFFVKTHSHPFCMYRFEKNLFIGQSLLTSILNPFSLTNPKDKLKDIDENTIIFPLSGPPATAKNLTALIP